MARYRDQERRGFTRVNVSLQAVVEGVDDVTDALLQSISLSGAYLRVSCFRTYVPLEEVSLYLLPRGGGHHFTVGIRARVVRVDVGGIGLQFRPMTLADHVGLRAIIAMAPETVDRHRGSPARPSHIYQV